MTTRYGSPVSIENKRNGLLVQVGDIWIWAVATQHLAKNCDEFDSVVMCNDFEERIPRPQVVERVCAPYKLLVRG